MYQNCNDDIYDMIMNMSNLRILLITALITLILCGTSVFADQPYEFSVSDAMTINDETEHWKISMTVPRISGMADEAEQLEINTHFRSVTNEIRHEYQESVAHAVESIKQGNDPNFLYEYRYDVITDNEDFYVIQTSFIYRSSSLTESSEYWTLDKATGRLLNFEDVVKTWIERAEIRNQIFMTMSKYNHDVGAPVYWTHNNSLDEALAHVGEKHHWYFNEDGDLVITFDKFEIGPAIVGSPHFTIDHASFNRSQCTHCP